VWQKTGSKLVFYFLLSTTIHALNTFIFEGVELMEIESFWSNILIVTWYLFNFPLLMMSLAVIYGKGNEDMIMDLSKLDYLCIVSIFQEQKKFIEDVQDEVALSPN
jgi:hypothetical protein